MKTGWTYRLYKLKCLLKHYLSYSYNRLLNPIVRQQRHNPKSIPIIIISFNQLYYLKQLVDFLLKLKFQNIVILDNHSSYPPLLEYLNRIEHQVILHRLDNNFGHLAFWKSASIFKLYSKGYYVITDPDIVPIEACPEDFMHSFIRLLDKAYDRTKVGFSLKTDDILDSNPNKLNILQWESKFKVESRHPLAFKAEIDTTFALYRPGYHYQLKDFTKAWRSKYPLEARHGGWYVDPDHLTDEQQYYLKTANASASWLTNTKGELVNTIHKPLYRNES